MAFLSHDPGKAGRSGTARVAAASGRAGGTAEPPASAAGSAEKRGAENKPAPPSLAEARGAKFGAEALIVAVSKQSLQHQGPNTPPQTPYRRAGPAQPGWAGW